MIHAVIDKKIQSSQNHVFVIHDLHQTFFIFFVAEEMACLATLLLELNYVVTILHDAYGVK